MKFTAVIALFGVSAVMATPAVDVTPNTVGALSKRAPFPIPASKGSVTFKKPESVKGVFDGGMKTYGRGVKCTGQKEGGSADAVFILEDGATLKNAIIGSDQIEGVHCKGACTIQNVWWNSVCEDALSLLGNGNVLVKGGGATGADDKVIQHNGKGTVTIDSFHVVDFGKLYRACGNCKSMPRRDVVVKNVKAYNGKTLVGINSNKGDTATISDTCASSVKKTCVEYEGTIPGKEPKEIHSGSSGHCKYSSVKSC